MKEKRILLIAFLLSIVNITLKSQIIELRLYIKDSCTNSVQALNYYEIEKDTFYYFSSGNNFVFLPDTGLYKLNSQYISGEIELKINNKKIFIDTLKKIDVYEVITVDQHPFFKGWLCCNKKCNGYRVGYYCNGNKRIEGTFKRGQPIGELKYYNEDGTLLYIAYYNKRGKYIKRQDF